MFKYCILALFITSSILAREVPPYYQTTDPRWYNEYLGTSSNLQMSNAGSIVCSVAMALNYQNLKVLGLEADPYVLNYYLNTIGWDGTVSKFPWDSIKSLGLQLINTLYSGTSNQTEYYKAVAAEVAKGKIVLPIQYKSTTPAVTLLANAFANQFVVLNPISSAQGDTVFPASQSTMAYVLIRSDSAPLEGQCGPSCATSPSTCEMFSCSAKSTSTLDCSKYDLGTFTLCTATDLTSDVVEFARCALQSSLCPFFITDQNGCYPKNGGKDGVYISGYVPLSSFASKLTTSTFLGAGKISTLKTLSTMTGTTLLNQIISLGAGLTDLEDSEIMKQYLTYIFTQISSMIPNFSKMNITEKTIAALFYIANAHQKDVLTSSKAWGYITSGNWRLLYTYIIKKSYDVNVPRYIDQVLQTDLNCSYPTSILSDIVLIMSRGNTEGANLPTYSKQILNLIRGFNIAPGSSQMGLIFAGRTINQLTSSLLDSQASLVNTFNQGYSAQSFADSGKNNLVEALSKASLLLNKNSRASQSGGDTTSISPQTIIVLTDGNYSAANPAIIAKNLKSNGVQIIVLTTSKDPSILAQLKLLASDYQAFTITDSSDAYKLVSNLVLRKKTITKQDSGTLKMNAFSGQTTYFEVPILNKGVTVTIRSNKDVANLDTYGSSELPYPNEALNDFRGKVDTIAQSIVLSGGRTEERRFLQAAPSYADSLKVGVKAVKDNHQLTIQIDPKARRLTACNERCASCDSVGAICYSCNDGFALYETQCYPVSTNINSTFGQIIWSNDGSNYFMYRFEADPTTSAGLAVPLILCIIASIVVFVVGLKKLVWEDIKSDEEHKPAGDKYKKDPSKPDSLEHNADQPPKDGAGGSGTQNTNPNTKPGEKEEKPPGVYTPQLKAPAPDPLQKQLDATKPKEDPNKNQSPNKKPDPKPDVNPTSNTKPKTDESQQAAASTSKKQPETKEAVNTNPSPAKSDKKVELGSPEMKQLPQNLEFATSPSNNDKLSSVAGSNQKHGHDEIDANPEQIDIGVDDNIDHVYEDQEGEQQGSEHEEHPQQNEEEQGEDDDNQQYEEEEQHESPDKLPQDMHEGEEGEEQDGEEGEGEEEDQQHHGSPQKSKSGGSPSPNK